MLRLVLLSLAGVIIFAGFAFPFLVAGTPGLIGSLALIVLGSVSLWFVESRTRYLLEADTRLNDVLKTDA